LERPLVSLFRDWLMEETLGNPEEENMAETETMSKNSIMELA
jgi:hypothetical protein